MRAAFLAVLLALVATERPIAAETPNAYLHCTGLSNLYGRTAHTIVLYTKTADVDGLPYSLGTSSSLYAMLAPNPFAELLPNEAALVLIEINRVTGDYKISAGFSGGIHDEHGRCTKRKRRL